MGVDPASNPQQGHRVLTKGAGQVLVHPEEERGLTAEGRGIDGIGAEREEGIAKQFGGRLEHAQVAGDVPKDVRHLRAVRGRKFDTTGNEGRPGGVGEIVGGVSQTSGLAMEVAVIA